MSARNMYAESPKMIAIYIVHLIRMVWRVFVFVYRAVCGCLQGEIAFSLLSLLSASLATSLWGQLSGRCYCAGDGGILARRNMTYIDGCITGKAVHLASIATEVAKKSELRGIPFE